MKPLLSALLLSMLVAGCDSRPAAASQEKATKAKMDESPRLAPEVKRKAIREEAKRFLRLVEARVAMVQIQKTEIESGITPSKSEALKLDENLTIARRELENKLGHEADDLIRPVLAVHDNVAVMDANIAVMEMSLRAKKKITEEP